MLFAARSIAGIVTKQKTAICQEKTGSNIKVPNL
jgi:hypothetical protein